MYGSAAGFETYHRNRGREISSTWDADTISAALLVASEYIDNRYKSKFIGYPTGGYTQERQWPRKSAYSNTFPVYVFGDSEIPTEVEEATYEAAWREINDQGSLYVDYTKSQYIRASVSQAVSVEYNENLDVNDVQKQIQIINTILHPVLDPYKVNSGLSGGSVRK